MSGRRQVWAENGLYVQVETTPGGALQITGHDTKPNPFGDSDFEYVLTVAAVDVPRIIQAVNGDAHADVLTLLEGNIEMIVHAGEMTWLKSIGISPGFWSYP